MDCVKCKTMYKTAGLDKFRQIFCPKSSFIVGDGGIGIGVEEFLSMDISKLF